MQARIVGRPFLLPVQHFLFLAPRLPCSTGTAGLSLAPAGRTVATAGRTVATAGRTVATAGDIVATAGHNGDTRGRSGATRGSCVDTRKQNGSREVSARATKLVEVLLEWRARARLSQVEAAEVLSVSRRVYALFEAGRWLPPDRERHFFAHTLHGLDARLGDAFARACGTTGEALGLPKPALTPPPGPAQARAAYDAALYSAAEEADVPAKTARVLVAAVVARLREAGVTMGQAEDCGRRTSSARSKESPSEPK